VVPESFECVCALASRWDEVSISGGDRWQIVQCRGCHTVTFLHEHWFSEEEEATEDGFRPLLHRDLYPPTFERKLPEWALDNSFVHLDVPVSEQWIIRLHSDVYSAIELKAYQLATIGLRSIVDHIVTSKAQDLPGDTFRKKLNRMQESGLISVTQVDVLDAVFDAGSAASHRGHAPKLADLLTMLEIAEALIEQFYVRPAKEANRIQAAADLKRNTPPRVRGAARTQKD
jgi:hypothetical protein